MAKRKVNENSLDNLKLGRLPAGRTALNRPVAVRLPPDLDSYVRSKPNKSEWILSVIQAAVEAEKQSA